jgi:hypothetical protein
MSKSTIRVVTLGALLLTFGLAMTLSAQTVNVTFRVNTATNLDTLNTGGFVQLRGAILNGDGSTTQEGDILPGGNNISWGAASDLILQNVGGDYWQGTFEFNANDTINFKLWTGFDVDNGTAPDGGWEGAFNPSEGLTRDTRVVIFGDADTTLPVMFYHPNLGVATDTYFRPYESKVDTVAVYFRVNMGGVTQAETFNPGANGPLAVRGNPATSGAVLNWDATTTVTLSRETNNVKDDHFWSGVAYIPKSALTDGSTQAYKFFVNNQGGIDWESGADRTFNYTTTFIATGDTTLHWDHFNRQPPTSQALIDANVTFRVSTEALEGLGLFDSALGDEINVIGAKGWDVTYGLPDHFIHLAFNPLLGEWTVSEPFRTFENSEIIFKYFVRWDSSRVDPTSPNYIPNIRIIGITEPNEEDAGEDSGWEEPAVTGGSDRRYTYTADALQSIPGDFGFDRNFFNSIPGNGVIPDPITVTWSVDMAPAADPLTNTNINLFVPGTDSVWIRPDGSFFALSQGFRTFGVNLVLLEDGDGDLVYTGSFTTTGPAPYQIEFLVAYGSAQGGIVTNGGGTALGRRYYQFVLPTSIDANLVTTWPSEFDLPQLDWVQSNLPFQDPPNLTLPTSVTGEEVTPHRFSLDSNYPNPFNPQTTIRYQVAQNADVKIEVYNIMGRLVNTLVDQKLNQGSYTVVWNGNNTRGEFVASGVYFVKMSAGFFKQIRKMTLVR